jgi:SAM-dependent methyltransferase
MKKNLGDESYDIPEFGMGWWRERAEEPHHDKAYKRIAKAGFVQIPAAKRIVDYACGSGLLIRKLIRRFPDAQIIGLDESEHGLAAADQMLGESKLPKGGRERVALHRALLPFEAPIMPKADLLFFSFPDFRGGLSDKIVRKLRKAFPEDWAAAKAQRKELKVIADGIEPSEAAEVFFKRMATRHYASLVKRGGVVVRVEYAQCKRSACDKVALAEMDWIDGLTKRDASPRLFSIIDSAFHRDDVVMSDVFHQTGNEDDQFGGYLITTFRKH